MKAFKISQLCLVAIMAVGVMVAYAGFSPQALSASELVGGDCPDCGSWVMGTDCHDIDPLCEDLIWFCADRGPENWGYCTEDPESWGCGGDISCWDIIDEDCIRP